ncbi:MAG: hypothetical protein ACU836_06410 [Gammaproteobacteria bacterium]
MDTLQKLMPILQDQALQWHQFTLERPDYAAAVAISVWLLMAIFYSIRIGFLKKDIAKLDKTIVDTQTALDSAQSHGKTLQQQIAEINGQLQQASETAKSEARRANDTEQRLLVCQQQLADSLVNLVDAFELNLHSLPAPNAENLLSEYQGVVARAVERFKNEQASKTQLQLSYHAESAKLAEKEMLISSLQHRFDTQTQQLAQLELAIEQYEAAQRQLQADKEQLLSQAVARQQSEAVRLADLERQQSETSQAALAKEKAQAAQIAALEKQKVQGSEPKPVAHGMPSLASLESLNKAEEQRAPVVELKSEQVKAHGSSVERAAVSKAAEPENTSPKVPSKFTGFFGKAMDKISKMDEKLGVKPNTASKQGKADDIAAAAQPAETKQEEVAAVSAVAVEGKSQPKKSEGFAKKLGILGGFKKTSANQQTEDAITPDADVRVQQAQEQESELGETAKVESKEGKKIASQFTGLLGKFKSKK